MMGCSSKQRKRKRFIFGCPSHVSVALITHFQIKTARQHFRSVHFEQVLVVVVSGCGTELFWDLQTKVTEQSDVVATTDEFRNKRPEEVPVTESHMRENGDHVKALHWWAIGQEQWEQDEEKEFLAFGQKHNF